MKKVITTLVLTILVSALVTTTVHAKNEFEDGFKYEMGAIAARSAVGLGIGLVTGVIHAEPYYAPPPPPRPIFVEPYYRPYRTRIYVERRVYHPRRHWARHSHGHLHQHSVHRHHDYGHDRHGHDGHRDRFRGRDFRRH